MWIADGLSSVHLDSFFWQEKEERWAISNCWYPMKFSRLGAGMFFIKWVLFWLENEREGTVKIWEVSLAWNPSFVGLKTFALKTVCMCFKLRFNMLSAKATLSECKQVQWLIWNKFRLSSGNIYAHMDSKWAIVSMSNFDFWWKLFDECVKGGFQAVAIQSGLLFMATKTVKLDGGTGHDIYYCIDWRKRKPL